MSGTPDIYANPNATKKKAMKVRMMIQMSMRRLYTEKVNEQQNARYCEPEIMELRSGNQV